MPSTDGTPAGHAEQTNRDAPEGTGAHGREAARWLHRDLLDRMEVVESIIKGMVRPERVQAWLDTEFAYGQRDDVDGPRRRVIALLNQRKRAIEDEDIPQPDEWARIRAAVRAKYPEWDESEPAERPDRRMPSRAVAPSSNTTTASEPETTEATGLTEFATAGGDETDG